MEIRKSLSALVLASLLLTEANAGIIPGFASLVAIDATQASSGDFVQEGASPKDGKTWIASITCAKNGVQQTFGSGDPEQVLSAVKNAISANNYLLTSPTAPLVRSDGGWDTNDNLHYGTLNAVCAILGFDQYVTSTCRDEERTSTYPNGKCNFHTATNNYLFRFQGTFSPPKAQCQDGIDNDSDGATDLADFGCSGNPNDDSEGNPIAQCQDGQDNDSDTFVDALIQGPQQIGGSVTKLYEGNQGPWDHVNQGGLAPTLVFSGIKAGERVKSFGANGSWSARINNGVDELPQSCYDQGYISFTDGNNVTIATHPIPTIANGFTVPTNATKMFVHVLDAPNEYFDNSGNRDNRAACSATFVRLSIPACRDGVDNDSDGVDFPADPECVTADDSSEKAHDPSCSDPQDNDESPDDRKKCSDGIDNDSDGAKDAADASCHSDLDITNPNSYQPLKDDEEFPKAACQDGQDNDGDGKIDYSLDPGCASKQDNSEKNPNGPQCDNGIDDDGDGKIDFPLDPGCTGPEDPAETDPVTPQCRDGLDNDADGFIDYPQDPACSNQDDNDESPKNAPNLEITKTAQATTVQTGDVIAYVINVKNTGNAPAGTDLRVHDVFLDAQGQNDSTPDFTFIGNTNTTVATCAPHNNYPYVIVCSLFEPIPAGGQRTFGIRFTANGGDSCGKTITNKADARLGQGQAQTVLDIDDATVAVQCPVTPQCRDGLDNDGDGAIDYPADFSCSGPDDIDETNPKAKCQDGIDNDGDGLIDFPQDPGCSSKQDNDEFNAPTPQCRDGLDNDNDGAIDYPADFSCSGPDDNDEANPKAQCQDGIDNDGDGLKDFPLDPGCSSLQDNDEFNQIVYNFTATKSADVATIKPGQFIVYTIAVQNNGTQSVNQIRLRDTVPAGLTFVPAGSTSGCFLHSTGLAVFCPFETYAPSQIRTYTLKFQLAANAQCGNNIVLDNVGDVQYPNGDGTNTSFQWSNHLITPVQCAQLPQCSDGIDNDGDGLIDFPQDPGCSSTTDNDEFNQLSADLSVTKTGPASITRGSVILYTVKATNLGPNTAQGVTISDPIPAGLTFNAGQSDASCIQNGSNILCDNTTLTSGASKTVTIAFNVPTIPNCTTSTIYNTATVSSAISDPNSVNNISQTIVTTANCPFIPQCSDGIDNDNDGKVDFPQDLGCSSPTDNDETNAPVSQCSDGIDNDGDGLIDFPQDPGCSSTTDNDEFNQLSADLSVTKTGPASITRGSVILYTVKATNLGPNTAQGVTISDPIPAGLTFNAGQSDASCIQNGSNILCDNTTLTSGASKTVTIAFNVPTIPNCTTSTIYNTATVSSAISDPNSVNNISQTIVTTANCPFIPQCSDGIDNDNDGKVDFPQDLGCSSPTDNDETNAPVSQCSDGIDNDGDGLIDFPQDPGCSSTTDNDEFNQLSADLSVTKTGPASITRGSVILYTVKATNLGPNTAQGVTISDPIPAGLTFNAGQSDASCIQNGSNILCDNTTLTSGASKTVTIAFNVPTIPNCTTSTIYNTATVSSAISDPNSVNNISQTIVTTANCPFIPQCSDGIDNDNDGKVDFPNDPGCLSSQDNDETNPPIPQCFDGIDNDGDGKIDFPQDPGCTSSNDDSELDQPLVADLSLVKSGAQFVQRGSVMLYTLTATNAGPDTATNVIIQDAIPSGLVFNPANSSPSCVKNGLNILCDNFSLASGQNRTVSIAFDVPSTVACGNVIQNVANVATSSVDPNGANNFSQTVSTLVQCPQVFQCSDTLDNDGDGKIDFPQDPGCTSSNDDSELDQPLVADLSLVKSGAQTVQRGSVMLYTLTATNAGPNTATNVIIQDAIPSGLVFNPANSSPSCVKNGLNILCDNFSLASGQSHTVSIAFDVPTAIVCDSTIQNVANVATSSIDPNGANNFSQTVSTVVKCPNPILSLTKTDGKTQAAPGETLNYTMTIQNLANVSTIGLTITDPLPSNVTFVSASNGGQLANGTVTWNNVVIPASSTVTLTLAVKINDAATNGTVIKNTFYVGTLTAEDTTTVVKTDTPTADLSIVKTGAQASVVRGSNVIYTITVTNNGPSQATGVIVNDTFPVGLDYVSVSGTTCQLALPGGQNPAFGGILSCDLGTIAPGGSKIFTATFSTSVPQNCTQTTVTNTASVSSAVTDPSSANNTDTEQTTLTCPVVNNNADLAIVKTGNISSVIRGENVLYTMTVTNLGPIKAQGVLVRDTFPSDLEYVSSSVSPCTVTGNVVECSLGEVEVNTPRTFTLTFKAKTIQNCTQSAVVTNSAAASATTTDPTSGNNVDTEQTTLTCPTTNTDADLSLVKTGPSTTTYGQTVTYTLTVKNNSNVTATNVIATDTFPSQMTYQPATSSAQCALTSGTVKCTLASLAAQQQTSFTLVFLVGDPPSSCSNTTITNTAVVSATNVDPVSSNNSSTVSSALTCNNGTIDQLSISKTDGRSSAYTQERLRYIITVNNNATTTVNAVTITDAVPSGLSIIAVSDGGTISGQQVTWSNLTFTGYQSRTFYVDVEVSDSIANGTVVTNTATVGAKQASDQTTIQKQTPYNPPYYPPYNPPQYPPYNPPHYPPYQPPVQPPYYPPVQPPIYPSVQPPIYSQPKPGIPPIYVYPETGGEASLYADTTETDNLTAVANGAEQGTGAAAIFYATLAAMLAIGSAAASKFLLGGGMLLG